MPLTRKDVGKTSCWTDRPAEWRWRGIALRIVEESIGNLGAYETVPIAFEVRSYFKVELVNQGLDGIRLNEESIDLPFVKDYDQEKGEGPSRWPQQWDVSHWGLITAFEGEERIGGAVVAWSTPEIKMLDGRNDRAALWDLRVRPDRRGRGVGRQLFRSVLKWAQDRGCGILKVETQNINVPACRLYAGEGCTLAVVNLLAYPNLPNEAQLIWEYRL